MGKPRKSFALWIMGHLLHALFAAIIFAVCALLIWRVFIASRIPSDLRRLVPNEVLADAYRENGEALTLWTQDQPTVTKAEYNYGYFGVPRFVFIDEANQLQVVFRYNNGTLRHTEEDYELAERPPRGEKIFDLSVVTVTDLTPENSEDNADSEALEKHRIAPTSCEVSTTLLYTYYFVVFDNIEISDEMLSFFLDIYYIDDIDYNDTAYGTLLLYDCESERLYEELSRKEEKALAAYSE